jgi:hypothetical protein
MLHYNIPFKMILMHSYIVIVKVHLIFNILN